MKVYPTHLTAKPYLSDSLIGHSVVIEVTTDLSSSSKYRRICIGKNNQEVSVTLEYESLLYTINTLSTLLDTTIG